MINYQDSRECSCLSTSEQQVPRRAADQNEIHADDPSKTPRSGGSVHSPISERNGQFGFAGRIGIEDVESFRGFELFKTHFAIMIGVHTSESLFNPLHVNQHPPISAVARSDSMVHQNFIEGQCQIVIDIAPLESDVWRGVSRIEMKPILRQLETPVPIPVLSPEILTGESHELNPAQRMKFLERELAVTITIRTQILP